MSETTDKVNQLAAALALVEQKKQELIDLYTQVDEHYAELRQAIDASRPVAAPANPPTQ